MVNKKQALPGLLSFLCLMFGKLLQHGLVEFSTFFYRACSEEKKSASAVSERRGGNIAGGNGHILNIVALVASTQKRREEATKQPNEKGTAEFAELLIRGECWNVFLCGNSGIKNMPFFWVKKLL